MNDIEGNAEPTGPAGEPRKAPLDDQDRARLEGAVTQAKRFIQSEMPYMYLYVNEVRARLEVESRGNPKGFHGEREAKLRQALQQLNGAKFCLEVALVRLAEVLE